MLSRFLNGQTISGYTQKDTLFEGVVQTNSKNQKAVVREDGKWMLLSNLKSIKQTGAKLNKVYESRISEVLDRLDPAKINFKEVDKTQLAKDVVTAAALDASDEDLVKEADAQLSVLAGLADKSDDELDKATDSSDALEPFKKDAGETDEKAETASSVKDEDKKSIGAVIDTLDSDKIKVVENTDSKAHKMTLEEELQYNENRKLVLEAKLEKERKARLQEDAEYDVAENYDDFDDEFDDIGWDASDYDDTYSDEEEVEDDSLYDDDFENKTFLDDFEDEVDADVDSEFEDALDDYEAQGGLYSDEGLIDSLAEAFKLDGKKALRESADIYEAVVKLAEQEKSKRLKLIEMTSSQLGEKLEKICTPLIDRGERLTAEELNPLCRIIQMGAGMNFDINTDEEGNKTDVTASAPVKSVTPAFAAKFINAALSRVWKRYSKPAQALDWLKKNIDLFQDFMKQAMGVSGEIALQLDTRVNNLTAHNVDLASRRAASSFVDASNWKHNRGF